MRTDLCRFALLGLLGLSALSGCSASQSKQSVSLRPDIGEVPPELRSDFESFSTNCNKCHDLERALAAPVTDNRHWDIYVAKMMRTAGSAINASEEPRILRFLYWYTDRKTGRTSAEPTRTTPTPAGKRESAPPHEEAKQAAPSPLPAQPATSETEGESTP